MAKPAAKPSAIKIVTNHVEESPEDSEMVNRLEAEADRDVAVGLPHPPPLSTAVARGDWGPRRALGVRRLPPRHRNGEGARG